MCESFLDRIYKSLEDDIIEEVLKMLQVKMQTRYAGKVDAYIDLLGD
jgi:hypothetical protein